MRSRWNGHLAAVLSVSLVLMVVSPTLAVAPAGKHYVTILLVIDPDTGDGDAQIGCLSFTQNEVCTENDDCGPFAFSEKFGARNLWTASIEMAGEATTVVFDGHGMTERRGRGSAIAGTALVTSGDLTVNGSFAGLQTNLAECLEVAASDDE